MQAVILCIAVFGQIHFQPSGRRGEGEGIQAMGMLALMPASGQRGEAATKTLAKVASLHRTGKQTLSLRELNDMRTAGTRMILSEDASVRASACDLLRLDDKLECREGLARALFDKEASVRKAALLAIADVGKNDSLPYLVRIAERSQAPDSELAVKAIVSIGKRAGQKQPAIDGLERIAVNPKMEAAARKGIEALQ